MTKKKETAPSTFRQRLRAQSADKLAKIASAMNGAAIRVVEESDSDINPVDVMRLVCNSQTKGLRAKLISDLSNEIERELEAIYNKQLGLDVGAKND
jgi:hypothetical protein